MKSHLFVGDPVIRTPPNKVITFCGIEAEHKGGKYKSLCKACYIIAIASGYDPKHVNKLRNGFQLE